MDLPMMLEMGVSRPSELTMMTLGLEVECDRTRGVCGARCIDAR